MQQALAKTVEPLDENAEIGALLVIEYARLRHYAIRLTGVGADADDLLQDTILRCWAARGNFQIDSNFGAWSRTIMRNVFLSGRRRMRFQADLPDGALDRMLSVDATQGEAVDLRDVDWAMGKLTSDHRDVVQLASQGVSIEEGAAQLSIPEGTFRSRLWRARARLRRLTEDRLVPLPMAKVLELRAEATAPIERKRRDWTGVIIG
ncbi:RNA polymerase sigma factor [Sphingomonas sp. PAMC 26605]|uniref:RNA polymerase sigma factor n=1 Tax=Sphingomonas sp. PAMC 26605 TaxID=1112214 RepID=UPI00026CD80E|nr:sigma-70 family RNA polymerase sigma factor [Sphingomonas sp. PAMC 26605]